ncbi:MAG: valine--tRNA ligase [Anaerolinea sp. 4484_236]|nr:MAG: valine--tRNA ligase [Anaerolinea sp. 4484_236]RLD05790.1 MAG: valine--tRNA ligase [Chloroflexota bacterium]
MTTHELPKAYDFQTTEDRIYKMWEESGYFKPTNDPNEPGHDPDAKPYVISIPPPNVTGKLHLGHALFVSMEDLMIRYQRMKGVPALWLPGVDHAGIATQLRVEQTLRKEGTTREEMGREAFLERTWAWKREYGDHITTQIRRLGASCDWSRERFTLDEDLQHSVREAFVHLWEKGLIYRGPRLINWSPSLQTAVSDIEVEHAEEQGTLYYFKYMLADGEGEFIPVATTRPETILGDTAVAVHPEDERYRQYIGRKALVPVLGREIPVIGDEYVTREFGTGALKITPAHDPNDYEIGLRHNLEMISMLDKAAKVTEEGGPYEGQDRFEARKNLWEDMRKAGLVIKEEPYLHQVPRAQRGGEIIEPMISTQWFVKTKPLAEKALAAVKDGRIKIIPDHFEKVYYNWMENIYDWCISRQLWWGHRIPVWYCDDCGKNFASREDPTECVYCQSKNLRQDPDVLDTWFSSSLWPFSTLGWPQKTPDLNYFYPTSMMETGYDILFFWVARMIMMGLEFTGEVPFSEIYLHGLVRDKNGKKMSKSFGNVIDPLVVMDELGTDALRFTLLVGSTPGKDMNLSVEKVGANRNFANKVWNASRYVISKLKNTLPAPQNQPNWTLADSWIWARLQNLTRTVERLFSNHQYGEAGRQIYDFFWSEFADWYLEISKQQISKGGDEAYYTTETLVRVLDTCLRLLHPFTPFVTEELWQHLRTALQDSPYAGMAEDWPDMLIIAPWPEARPKEEWETSKVNDFALVQEIIRIIRNLRAEKSVHPGHRIPAAFVSAEYGELLRGQKEILAALAHLDAAEITIHEVLADKPEGHIALVAGPVEIYLPLAGLVDPAEERARLTKELAETEGQIQRLDGLLSGPFAQKAPEAVVQKERDKLEDYREMARTISEQLAVLGG